MTESPLPLAPVARRSWLANDRLPWVAGSLALLAPITYALSVSLLVTPDAIEHGDVTVGPTCWLRGLLGGPCPTCGLSRAFAALGHGDLDRAVALHRGAPALYALYWIVGVACAAVLARHLSRWNAPERKVEHAASLRPPAGRLSAERSAAAGLRRPSAAGIRPAAPAAGAGAVTEKVLLPVIVVPHPWLNW